MCPRSVMIFVALLVTIMLTPLTAIGSADPQNPTRSNERKASNNDETGEELSEWNLVNTEHFAVVSNTDPERAKLIAYKLEQYRYVFGQLVPDLVNATPLPTRVHVYRDGSSYSAGFPRQQNLNSTVAGYFLPGRDLISINDLFNISDDVSYHEYTHLLTRFDKEYPLWFTEGIAEFFETFEIEGHQVRIGDITPSRLNILRINSFIPLRKFLNFRSYNQVMQDYSLDTFYSEAWLITHYLMIDDQRRARLADFLRQIHEGKPMEAAFTQAFQSDFDKLEDELRLYLATGKFQLFTLAFNSEKVDSDVTIIPLTETEKIQKLHLDQNSNVQTLSITVKRKDDAEASTPRSTIIPDFTRLAETIGIKLAASTRPVKLPPSDPNMASRAKEAVALFNTGNRLSDAGDRDGALAKYEQTLKLDPEFAPAYMSIGNIYAQMKLYDMARLAFEKARAVAPNYAGTYLNFAVMQFEQGRPEEAEASFRVALSLYPSSAASHLGLGNIYLQRRDYARARNEYSRTLSLVRGNGPEALNAYIGLGAVYFHLGDYEKAKEQYRQAIRLEPNNGTWHRAFADNCRMLKQYDQATESYLRAIELNSKDSKAQESLEWLRKIAEYQRTVKPPTAPHRAGQ